MKNELTTTESRDLKKLEATIQAGKNTFVSVGLALTEIRDRKLYRAEFSTFDEYTAKRWGWTRQRATQLTQAAQLTQGLPAEVVTNVTSEGVARALKKVPPSKRVKVIKKAAEAGPVTAKAVEKAAEQEGKDIEMDELGYPIPEGIQATWRRRHEVDEPLHLIAKVGSYLERFTDKNDPVWGPMHVQEAVVLLNKAHANLSLYRPYAVCVVCQGHPDTQPNKSCRGCKGTGFVGRYMWNNMDKKLRELREKMVRK